MIYRELGKTGMKVSRLGFGSMGLRGPKTWGVRVADDKTSDTILNRALDLGINFIDTSPDYGIAEQRIGDFIGNRRDEFFLATKCGCVYHEKDGELVLDHQWTKSVVQNNLDTSLKRLKTDYLDVLQFHGGSAKQLTESGLIDLLLSWKKKGLVRAIGVSSKIPMIDDLLDLGVFDVVQLPFSCLQAEHLPTILKADKAGVGVIVRGGIGQGGPEAEIQRANNNAVWEGLKLNEILASNSTTKDWKPADILLQWTLNFSQVHTTIVGTANSDHLQQNVDCEAGAAIPKDVFDSILSRVGTYFGMELQAADFIKSNSAC